MFTTPPIQGVSNSDASGGGSRKGRIWDGPDGDTGRLPGARRGRPNVEGKGSPLEGPGGRERKGMSARPGTGAGGCSSSFNTATDCCICFDSNQTNGITVREDNTPTTPTAARLRATYRIVTDNYHARRPFVPHGFRIGIILRIFSQKSREEFPPGRKTQAITGTLVASNR